MAFSIPSFSSFFSKPTTSVVGIDIGMSAIKVVQLRKEHGQVILETYGALALGGYGGVEIGRAVALPPEKLTEALKDVLREANITAKKVAVSIPYSSSLVSIIKVPSAVEKDLANVIPLEARKYIPVPINEVMLDWSVVGGEGPKSDTIEVLVVAIHKETLEKFRSVVANAGLEIAFFEIEVFSAVRAVLDHSLAPTAVVDFGASSTKFYVVERGIMRESHIIAHGSQDLTLAAARSLSIPITKAEELKRQFGITDAMQPDLKHSLDLSLSALLGELSRNVLAYEQRTKQSLSTLVFTGGGATLKGLLPLAQTKLQNEITLADPFTKAKAPAFLEPVLKEAGPEFSVAMGLALRQLSAE